MVDMCGTTKVICVSKGNVPSLTLHKIYIGFIFPSPATTIQVVDDSGYVKTYKGERFMELSEYRQKKLKSLGL